MAFKFNPFTGKLDVVNTSTPGGGDTELTEPVFTYNPDDTLQNITYADGTTKDFTYSGGRLDTLVTVFFGGSTSTKTFNYNVDGLLESIDEVII